jgi:hypothetical protein
VHLDAPTQPLTGKRCVAMNFVAQPCGPPAGLGSRGNLGNFSRSEDVSRDCLLSHLVNGVRT